MLWLPTSVLREIKKKKYLNKFQCHRYIFVSLSICNYQIKGHILLRDNVVIQEIYRTVDNTNISDGIKITCVCVMGLLYTMGAGVVLLIINNLKKTISQYCERGCCIVAVCKKVASPITLESPVIFVLSLTNTNENMSYNYCATAITFRFA